MNLLENARTQLRITSTAYDQEIYDLIEAAKDEMELTGLMADNILESDPLIVRAIILYCKANFGWNNPDSEKYQRAYESLRNHISMSLDYAYFAVTFTISDSLASPIRLARVQFMRLTDTKPNSEQEKYTDENGQCIFYVRAGNNYKYNIYATDYVDDTYDLDDEENLVDISEDTAIAITMVGV